MLLSAPLTRPILFNCSVSQCTLVSYVTIVTISTDESQYIIVSHAPRQRHLNDRLTWALYGFFISFYYFIVALSKAEVHLAARVWIADNANDQSGGGAAIKGSKPERSTYKEANITGTDRDIITTLTHLVTFNHKYTLTFVSLEVFSDVQKPLCC